MPAETAIEKSRSQTIDVAQSKNTSGPRRNTWTYRPQVDIFDTPTELLLYADLPGADPESVDVTIESGILTIEAGVPARHRDQAHVVAHEYGVGNFHRRFEIDESIDAEQVYAEYRDGCLKVTLPKSQHARRRKIAVTS